MDISKNLDEIRKSLDPSIKLVAVSKTKSNQQIMEAYNHGQRIFGENKVQELTLKQNTLPNDIKWHMIGHLHLKLLKEINKQALKNNLTINCLLQIKIASEDTKFGMSIDEAKSILSQEVKSLNNISIVGLMGMASFTNDQNILKKEFSFISNFFNEIKTLYPKIKILSIGMSDDYRLAIKYGSNMIRIGSSIFGSRN